jgi:Raf kinase inhibitor-like YbhB/YbcL family protein
MHYLFISTLFAAVMTAAPGTDSSLTVTSTAFSNNASIPMKYSCEGIEASPPLQINNIPAGAKSLAVILHDPDAGPDGFTHWVMWNVATDGSIPEEFRGGDQGKNGSGKNGYKGMCPPTGTHHYHFTVYALDTMLDIDENTNKAGLQKSMDGHILAQGELVGLYKKAQP